MHELKHALGFYHEQSRNDRDNYITVDYSNVQSGKASQFQRMSLNEIQQFTPYDYGSLMHYGAYSFAADRSKPTIIPKKAGVTIGQRIRLSDYDIQEIRTLYSCGGTSTSTGGSVTQPPVVTNQPTTGSVSGLPKGTCTFESGLCGWTQDTYDSHDWTIRSGSTPSGSTGPTSAYGGSGKYVYVEASGYSNKIARLVSPMLTTTGATPFCLRFNYHMYGADMGRLTIGSKFGTTYRPIVYFSGDKGTSWRTARFTINTSSAGSFSFYLEGTVGTNYRSDIAIDNLNLASGKCT
ncbi:meprin A subunit alpha-like [Lingula anatina]|uniref:Metalloendopeptidase n=1 Tax=Lingula anatina TaxID=7574 RepID=A0A1S3KGX8_LINAN|nr:meprin A subunit alpha-like [Lingula anatina]|eukprot:XP_013421714.1 meprin A subunit alpha-like [Lingula anatina]